MKKKVTLPQDIIPPMEPFLLKFIVAGFTDAFKSVIDSSEKIQKSIEDLKMALLDKIKELESKTDALVGSINTEKSEVSAKLTELGTEIETLKQKIADLQKTLDGTNADQSALSDLIDQQIAKVDAAAEAVAGIITPDAPAPTPTPEPTPAPAPEPTPAPAPEPTPGT